MNNIYKLSVLLLILTWKLSVFSQGLNGTCPGNNYVVLFEDWEFTAIDPFLLPGTTYQNSPQTHGPLNGSRHLYLNFVNGSTGLVYDRLFQVCPGVPFEVTCWMHDTWGGTYDVTLEVYDGVTLLNSQVLTGNGPYFQYSSGALTSVSANISWKLSNNSSTIGNNDFAMDDLQVSQCDCDGITANFSMNDTTICAGETITFSDSSFIDPTIWNWTFNGGDITSANTQGTHDITFNTPGIYDIILSVSNGTEVDDTTLQVVVSGYPTLDAGINDTICVGENYTLTAIILEGDATVPVWDNGVIDGVQFTPIDSMMYYVTSNINGCESIDSVNIDLTEIPDLIMPLDFAICEEEDTLLNATTTTANAIITWDNGVVNNQLFTPLFTTVYTATSTLTEGTVTCTFTNQTEITVNIIPTINAGLDAAICEGENYILTGENPDGAILIWNNGINDNIQFSPLDSLQYIVLAELNGCINMDTVIIDVNPNPDLSVPLAITICDEENVVLNATSTNTLDLVWDNGVVNNQVFTPLNTTLYAVTATITVGGDICTTTGTTMVTVNPNPTVDADGSGATFITLCEGDSYVLTADNPNNGVLTWTNNVIDNVSFIPTDSLMYYVISNVDGCIGLDSIIIDVVDSPIANAGLDQTICIGDSVLMQATSNQVLASINWGQGIVNNTFIYPLTTQIYYVTTSLGNCTSTDEMTITVVSLPDAGFSFNPNPVTIEDTELEFTQHNLYDGELYDWSFGDNMSSSLDSPIHIYPEIAGLSYEVKLIVTDSIGCIDSSSTQVTIFDVLIYYIPNAFTPDGDTYNETFQPVFTSGFDPYDYHLVIFNRWGETVFESYNDQEGWDGSYNGGNAPDGVYVWTVKFGEILSDKKYNDKGIVTLVR